jgi:hypothetical protein
LAGLSVIALSSTAMATILVAGGLYQPPKLDATTLCRLDAPLVAHHVVVVDGTDRFSPAQAAIVTGAVDREATLVPRFGKLTVLLLSGDHPGDPEEVFAGCNPGTGGEADGWIEGPKRLDRVWQTRFHPPLARATTRLLTAKEAPSSPLMETITAIAKRADFAPSIRDRRLAVVSDLIQFTPGVYTQYQMDESWARFARTALASQADADLSNIAITVDYIERPQDSAFQGPAHVAFWRRWFKDHRAVSTEIRLPGLAATIEQRQEAGHF